MFPELTVLHCFKSCSTIVLEVGNKVVRSVFYFHQLTRVYLSGKI